MDIWLNNVGLCAFCVILECIQVAKIVVRVSDRSMRHQMGACVCGKSLFTLRMRALPLVWYEARKLETVSLQ